MTIATASNNWLTPEDIATRLKVNLRTVYGWLRSGELRGYKLGDLWRVAESDLENFIKHKGESSGKSA